MSVSVRNESDLTPSLSRFLENANSRTIFSMNFDLPRRAQRCHAMLDGTSLGHVDILRYSGSGLQKCERRREHILEDRSDDFYLCLPQRGEFGFRCAGVESKSRPNSFIFFSTNKPFEAYISETPSEADFSCTFVRIPAALLRHRVPRIEELCGHSIPATRGIAQAMKATVQIAQQEAAYMREEQKEIVCASTMDFVCVAAMDILNGAQSCSCPLSAAEKTFQRAKSFIEANLSDQGLSPQMVANHCQVSTRYLNTVFSKLSRPVAAYIRELRLQRCNEALCNNSLVHRSIIEIATEWGFSSSSHFSQVYKSRFGRAPRFERPSPRN